MTSTPSQAARHAVLVFGGSFDPVHQAHVSLVQHVATLCEVDEIRLIPAGQPWQKAPLVASAEQRVAMLQLAFDGQLTCPYQIDLQEIERARQGIPSYTVQTLEQLRADLGNECALILLIGADQFHNFTSWKDWARIFTLAHVVVAARPGYHLQHDRLPQEFAQHWERGLSPIKALKQYPFGKTCLDTELAWDISATQIRQEWRQDPQCAQTRSLIPGKVLDYLQQHAIYQTPTESRHSPKY